MVMKAVKAEGGALVKIMAVLAIRQYRVSMVPYDALVRDLRDILYILLESLQKISSFDEAVDDLAC